MQCPRGAGEHVTKAEQDRQDRQVYRCRVCNRRSTERSGSAFSGYRFSNAVIALAVRWYVRSLCWLRALSKQETKPDETRSL